MAKRSSVFRAKDVKNWGWFPPPPLKKTTTKEVFRYLGVFLGGIDTFYPSHPSLYLAWKKVS